MKQRSARARLIADLAGREGVHVVATMTTLNEDPEFEKLQLQRFREIEETLAARGISMGRRHAAASFALFDNPRAYLDAVRPGMALFGQYSMPRFREMGLLDLRPSMSLKARVVLVKELQKGDTAGYEAAYKADQNVWIATIPPVTSTACPGWRPKVAGYELVELGIPSSRACLRATRSSRSGRKRPCRRVTSPPISTGRTVRGPRTRARLPVLPSTT